MKVMMNKIFLAFFVLLLSSTAVNACEVGDPYPYKAPYAIEKCPEDIQEWMERQNACWHMEEELPHREGEDAAYMEEQMKALDCFNVGCDYYDLFAKYEGDIAYTGTLTGYIAFIYGMETDPECIIEDPVITE